MCLIVFMRKSAFLCIANKTFLVSHYVKGLTRIALTKLTKEKKEMARTYCLEVK